MPVTNRLYAEFLGTAWLVLGGCGSAVLAAGFPQLGIGFAGVALAFGLTVREIAETAQTICNALRCPPTSERISSIGTISLLNSAG